MSGLRLSGMEMRDMLDVIHVILEDDITQVQSGEHIDAKDKVRTIFYRDFYNKKYILANKPSSNQYNYDLPLDDEIVPFDPKQQPTKSYVPPTVFDEKSAKPFGKNLDAPLA